MIKMSGGPSGEAFSAVVIIAFDPTNGDIHATYTHGYYGETDEAEIERSRETLLKDVRRRLGICDNVELVQVRLDELEGSWIDRVDPTSGSVIMRRRHDITMGITCP